MKGYSLAKFSVRGVPLILETLDSKLGCLTLVAKTGTKYEDATTSGVNLVMKMFLLNPTNYSKVKETGGSVSCSFDQEYTTYSLRFPRQCFKDYAKILADSLSPTKTIEDELIANKRLTEYLDAKSQALTLEERAKELWLPIAYGVKGVGMPLHGLQSLKPSLTYKSMNELAYNTVRPDSTCFVLSGISESEAIETLNETIHPTDRQIPDISSIYKGGDSREECETSTTYITVAYEGAPALTRNHYLFELIKEDFNSYSFFDSPRHLHKLQTAKYKRIMMEAKFIRSLECINASFSDTGSFGLSLSVDKSNVKNASRSVSHIFEELMNWDEVELQRAKTRLKVAILKQLESIQLRCQELGRMQLLNKKLVDLYSHLDRIEELNISHLQAAVGKLETSKPTIIVVGSESDAFTLNKCNEDS